MPRLVDQTDTIFPAEVQYIPGLLRLQTIPSSGLAFGWLLLSLLDYLRKRPQVSYSIARQWTSYVAEAVAKPKPTSVKED